MIQTIPCKCSGLFALTIYSRKISPLSRRHRAVPTARNDARIVSDGARAGVGPMIVLFFWGIRPGPGVAIGFGGNAFFATLFVVSALLFRRASAERSGERDLTKKK